jgi:PASTA domain
VAVLAAAVFPLLATAARADVMTAGTYSGQITGGTLTLGNGKFHDLPVPAGTKFSFVIPAGASTPVAWTAPGLHVDLPLQTETDSGGTVRTAVGSLDISEIAGAVDPASGLAHATATAHGALRLTTTPPGFTQYCSIGEQPSAGNDPMPPLNLSLDGTGSLIDTTFDAQLDCGSLIPPGAPGLPNIGDSIMASGMNALSLSMTFTRQPDPQPTIKVVTQTITTTTPAPPPANCVVPKVQGLKLAKARAALKKANCTVGKVTRKKSSRKATVVLKQNKKAGAVLAHGSKIALTIAR